jgi:predicted transcriptional regulator
VVVVIKNKIFYIALLLILTLIAGAMYINNVKTRIPKSAKLVIVPFENKDYLMGENIIENFKELGRENNDGKSH